MLVNFNEMLQDAKKNKYAIAHFNINNLEWAKYILEEVNDLSCPVILGVSEGAARYMGGFIVISKLVEGLMESLNIRVPVCLHLDHGSSFESCKAAIDAGFSSVMIDASRHELDVNVNITKKVVDYAHQYNVSVEAEVGHIGGDADNIYGDKYMATLDDCLALAKTGIDAIAPALGSVHGLYHGKPNLNFERMQQINEALEIPLVLHGGTGIPYPDIKKAIACGISKININTELQVVWHDAVVEFIHDHEDVYDTRKVISSGEKAMKQKIKELIMIFNTPLGNKNEESNII